MDASEQTTPNDALPDDIATLKQLVASRDDMIARLMAEIARLKRWQYGRSSERIDALTTQLQLALGELPVSTAPVPDAQAATVSIAPSESTRDEPISANLILQFG